MKDEKNLLSETGRGLRSARMYTVTVFEWGQGIVPNHAQNRLKGVFARGKTPLANQFFKE